MSLYQEYLNAYRQIRKQRHEIENPTQAQECANISFMSADKKFIPNMYGSWQAARQELARGFDVSSVEFWAQWGCVEHNWEE